MHHLFIYLFICWSSRMIALLFCYAFVALCTSKDDTSASAICYLWRFFLVHYYTGRPSWASLTTLVAFPMAFISLCSLCCNILSAKDCELTLGMGIFSYSFNIPLGLFGPLLLWIGTSVLKRIINQSIIISRNLKVY